MDRARRAEAFERFDEAIELPMLVLALLFVPVLLAPYLLTLSARQTLVLDTVGWVIWGAFAAELAIKTFLAPRRWSFLRAHWFDVLIVVLPLFRPLRLARTAKALRALAVLRTISLLLRLLTSARALLRHHGLHWTLLVGLVLLVGSAAAMTYAEQGGEGSIDDFGTALWWALVTVTTVGYGDAYPVTPAGKGIAIFLMVIGIALFGLVTATIAAFLVEQNQQSHKTATLEDVLTQLAKLEAQVADVRAALTQAEAAPPQPPPRPLAPAGD